MIPVQANADQLRQELDGVERHFAAADSFFAPFDLRSSNLNPTTLNLRDHIHGVLRSAAIPSTDEFRLGFSRLKTAHVEHQRRRRRRQRRRPLLQLCSASSSPLRRNYLCGSHCAQFSVTCAIAISSRVRRAVRHSECRGRISLYGIQDRGTPQMMTVLLRSRVD